MLRKIFITAAVVGIPLAAWTTYQYAQPQAVSFETSVMQAENRAESEQTKKFLVRGKFVSMAEHNHEEGDGHSHDGTEFMMADGTGKVFKVQYTGQDKIDHFFKKDNSISVLGHVHGAGNDVYFHASQAFEKY